MTTNSQAASRALTWPQRLGLRVGALHRRHGRKGVIVASIAGVASVCLLFAVIDWGAVASLAMTLVTIGAAIAMFLYAPSEEVGALPSEENFVNDDEADGWRDGLEGIGFYMGGIRVDEDM